MTALLFVYHIEFFSFLFLVVLHNVCFLESEHFLTWYSILYLHLGLKIGELILDQGSW